MLPVDHNVSLHVEMSIGLVCGSANTRFDIPMRIRPHLSRGHPFLTPRHLSIHQRLLLHLLHRHLPPIPSSPTIRLDLVLRLLARLLIRLRRLLSHLSRTACAPLSSRRLPHPVLMHCLQRPAHAQK